MLNRPGVRAFYNQSRSAIQSAVGTRSVVLRPRHGLFLISLGLMLVSWRGMEEFAFRNLVAIALFGFVFSVPMGWLVVTLLLPDLESKSARIALIVTAGYAVSVLTGFFITAALGRVFFLGICLLCGAVALVPFFARKGRFQGARSTWANPSVWIVAALTMASITVASPLLSPLERVTPALYMEYVDVDGFFHVSRVQMLSQQVPMATSPDLAGVKPSVYPDLSHFWIGQLAAWTTAGARSTYLTYAPMLLILATAVVMYATGKALTNSRWGGYLAAALGCLIVVPNPLDATFFLRRSVTSGVEWNAERMHFADLRFGLAYGVGWLMVSGVVLALALYAQHKNTRTGIGLLTVGSLALGVLLRIRPHFSIIVVPVYLLILVYLLGTRRRWQYLVPIVTLGVTSGALYAESISGNYQLISAELGIGYGVFAESIAPLVPGLIRNLIDRLPSWLEPTFIILALATTRVMGLAYSIVIGVWMLALLRKREIPSLPILFLFGVLTTTLIGVLTVIVEPLRADGGDWGGQAILILPRVAVLLAVVPLFKWGRALSERVAFVKQNALWLALIGLALGGAISLWGAESVLHSESLRAYVIQGTDIEAYRWISENTAGTAVIAADPDHKVNGQGETLGRSNFLSGMTERPAYLQRLANRFFVKDIMFRQELLTRLFEADSVEQVQSLLRAATFDYLIVYPDRPPKTDLGCCMRLIRSAYPQIYQHDQ